MGYENPLLKLPAVRQVMALPADQRGPLEALMRELRADADRQAEESWRKRKGPMAAYWRAVSTYARHVAHALSKGHQANGNGVPPSRPMQPTPYGLAGIEGDAIVIRLTADACAFAFANDPQAQEPRPPVIDKQQFLRDTLNELTSEREDGSTPLTDMLDRAMVKAMENGSDALDHDAADGVKGSE